MIVDVKKTTWERIEVPSHLEAKVKAGIESGKFLCGLDVYDFISDNNRGNVEFVQLESVDEYMHTDDNGGAATVELYNDPIEMEPILTNDTNR